MTPMPKPSPDPVFAWHDRNWSATFATLMLYFAPWVSFFFDSPWSHVVFDGLMAVGFWRGTTANRILGAVCWGFYLYSSNGWLIALVWYCTMWLSGYIDGRAKQKRALIIVTEWD